MDFVNLNIIPPAILDLLRHSVNRVIIIAGNSELTFRDFERLSPGDDDLIVLINRCIHVSRFINLPSPKLFIFRGVRDTGTHWGFPPNPGNFAGLDASALGGTVGMILTRTKPPLGVWPPAALHLAQNAADHITVVSEDSSVWADYPLKANYKYAGPSTGFLALSLFLSLKENTEGGTSPPDFEIVTFGFSENSSDDLWEGHSWEYEREFLNQHQDKVRRVPLGLPDLGMTGVEPRCDYRGEFIRRFGTLDESLESALSDICNSPNDAAKLVRLATEVIKKDQPQLALELLNEAIALDKTIPEAHLQRSMALQQLSEFKESASYCRTLAKNFEDEGEMTNALHVLDDAVDRSIKTYELLLQRSALLEKMGCLVRALADAREASELIPNQAHPKACVAAYLEKAGALISAVEILNEAITMDRREASLYHQKSALLGHLGKHDEALACARQAVDLAENNAHLHGYLAKLLGQRNENVAALRHLDLAIRIEPDCSGFYSQRARVLERMGQVAAAILSARKSIDLDPTRPWPHAILASLLTRTKDVHSALIHIDIALAAAPGIAKFHHQKNSILKQIAKNC